MPYMTGAIASPRHKLAAAFPHQATEVVPSQFARIPAKLSMWMNSKFGTCVSAEEAFAKGGDGLWVTDDEVYQWAKKRGYLNGAVLTDVLDDMQKVGLVSGDQTWEDGAYFSVNWEDTHLLCDAIYTGVVKIGVASSQLPQAETGWSLLSARKDRRVDHCVALCGYGPLQWCCNQVGATVPGGVDPGQPAYLCFTWNSIGVISQTALNAICGEAWVRKPTTVGIAPPTPVPPPIPDPEPPPQPPNPIPEPTPVPMIDWIVLFNLLVQLLQQWLSPKTAQEMADNFVAKVKEEYERG